MTPLYTVADTRAIERAMFAAVPSFELMQQAGAAVAAAAVEMLADSKSPVLAIAGGGNNGGDAAIAAHILKQNGYPVQLLFCGNAEQLPADAARALRQWQADGGETLTPDNISDSDGTVINLPPAALLIDGVFGIGLSRQPQGLWRRLIEAMNHHAAPVLAIDVPSGLNADSGTALGVCICAAKTVTFFGAKPGLYTGDGVECGGQVQVARLDAPAAATASGRLMQTAPPLSRLKRRANSHKGDYKTVALIGGAAGMLGALVLAARAAASMGAGKTIACAMAHCPPVDWHYPEIMWHTADSAPLDNAHAIAAGMGLGTDDKAAQTITDLLPLAKPLLLDADALTLLAQNQWHKQLAARAAATILTPHPAEAARLLRCDTAAVISDRPAATAELCRQWQATVVLKGAGSIIQTPGQPFIICAAGNAGLARGGSGDVLAGLIASLLTQTQDAAFAATAGVWLHAAAADRLAQQHGKIGLDINQLAKTAAQLAEQ